MDPGATNNLELFSTEEFQIICTLGIICHLSIPDNPKSSLLGLPFGFVTLLFAVLALLRGPEDSIVTVRTRDIVYPFF